MEVEGPDINLITGYDEEASYLTVEGYHKDGVTETGDMGLDEMPLLHGGHVLFGDDAGTGWVSCEVKGKVEGVDIGGDVTKVFHEPRIPKLDLTSDQTDDGVKPAGGVVTLTLTSI